MRERVRYDFSFFCLSQWVSGGLKTDLSLSFQENCGRRM